MEDFTFVKLNNMHGIILGYIKDNDIKIVEYEDMKECVLKMIREKYIFNVNRDRLRDAMEDLTYMFSPNDEINKDRVNKGLEYEYDDDDFESDSDDDKDNEDEDDEDEDQEEGDNNKKCDDCPNKKCDDCPDKKCDKEPIEEVKDEPDEESEEVN